MEHSDPLQRLSLIAPEPNPALTETAREFADEVSEYRIAPSAPG